MKEPAKLPLFYFLIYASFAAWLSFFNVHLNRLGFSGMQIGTLNAVFISTSAFVVPFWGMVADKYGNNRILLLLSVICAIIIYSMGQTTSFYGLVLLILMISFFQQPMGAVMDGMTMGLVMTTEKYSYGQFRLWGSAGYAVSSLIVGYFAMKNTSLIFPIASALFALLSVINLITLPKKPVTGRSKVNFRSFSVFFHNRKLFFFLLIIFLFGIGISPLHQFINLYYTDIGAGSRLIGIAYFVQAAFEIPSFLIGVKLVRKTGAANMILLAMAVSVLRLILYGFIRVPEYAIFVGILHGFTISFFLIGVVEYVQAQTPGHLRTTGQALIWAFHFGAGLTLGNLWLGYLRDQVGMLKAMHIQAFIAVAVVGGMFLFLRTFANSKAE